MTPDELRPIWASSLFVSLSLFLGGSLVVTAPVRPGMHAGESDASLTPLI